MRDYSRLALLVALVLLFVVFSSFNVWALFGCGWMDGVWPWLLVGLTVSYFMRGGGCCGRACRPRTATEADL